MNCLRPTQLFVIYAKDHNAARSIGKTAGILASQLLGFLYPTPSLEVDKRIFQIIRNTAIQAIQHSENFLVIWNTHKPSPH